MVNAILNDKKKSCYRSFSIIVSLIGLGVIIVFVILGCLIQNSQGSILYPLSTYFGNNWNYGPSSTIDFETSSSCPIGSSYLLEGIKFPAISEGCFCPPNQIKSGVQCSESDISSGCQNYGSSQSQSIYSWDSSLPCSTREQNSNYFQLNLQTSAEECIQASLKACGNADSIGSILCVNPSDDCPINYFKIYTQGDFNPSDLNFSVNTQTLNNNKLLVYSTENTKGSIVNQFLVIDHLPCANELENKLQFQGDDYLCKTAIDGQTLDLNWNLVDKDTLEDLVNSNNLNQQFSNYPFYDLIKSENVYLYQRSYIGINQSCIQSALTLYSSSVLPSLFLNLKNEVSESSIDYISMISITLYVFFFLGLLIRIILACLDFSDLHRLYLNTILAFCSILLLIVACVGTVSISNSRNIYVWFDSGCSDPISYGNLEMLDSVLYRMYAIGVVFSIFSLFLFFITISDFLIMSCDCGPEDPDEDNNDSLNNSQASIEENEVKEKESNTNILEDSKKGPNLSINKDLNESDEDEILINTQKKNQ